MRAYRAEATIAAPPEQVWAVLTDFPAYPAWNPFTVRVQTPAQIGEPVVMRVRMKGLWTLTQSETLTAWDPPERLVWALDIGLPWLIWAERVQTLAPVDGGGTHYVTVDRIGGLLGPVTHLIFGRALTWGFTAMAAALKERVEATPPGPR